MRPANAPRWHISVINGPNMSNLGHRDKEIYGSIASLSSLEEQVSWFAELLGVVVNQYASNQEGDILEFIHRQAAESDAFLINPAGLTTYGEATRHALADTSRPYVEVHFANIDRYLASIAPQGLALRSRFTHSATGLVMGLRQYGYFGALLALTLALDDADFLGRARASHPR
ncbi:MAG: type II 3-dehydroquinate dehydratase [Acidimicrobiales bacterium]